MKYILEIKPEYKDSFKGLMVLGAKDSDLFVDALAVEDLEELTSDYINEHYGDLQDTAYRKGRESVFHELEISGSQKGESADDAYERGHEIGYQKGFEDGKAQRTYDDKIEVGDEVEHNSAHDIKVLVTDVNEEEKEFGGLALTASEHNCDIGDRYSNCKFKRWHKTGRHFDIASILEEMRK